MARNPVRILLVRHGESEGNQTRTFTHSPQVPLTERGRAQARAAAERIAKEFRPVRVLSSPFARARETAQIIADRLLLEVEPDAVWREQSLGRLAGRPYDCVLEDPKFDPERTWAWRPPEGESLEDVKERIAPPLEALLSTGWEEVVLVSHAGVMQAIWAHLTGTWEGAPIPRNAEVFLVERCSATTIGRID